MDEIQTRGHPGFTRHLWKNISDHAPNLALPLVDSCTEQ